MTASYFSDWCEILSSLLLTLSPFIVLYGITRNPRIVVYLSGEMLFMLTAAFLFRYQEIWSCLLSFQLVPQKIQIVGFASAFFLVHHWQARVCIPKPKPILLPNTTDSEEASDHESLLPRAESESAPRSVKALQIQWPLVVGIFAILFPIFLFYGEHSFSNNFALWYTSQPHDPFLFGFSDQLRFISHQVELHAIWIQYLRGGILYKQAPNLLKQHQADPEISSAVDEDELKKRLTLPVVVWIFIALSQIGAALMLPSMIRKVCREESGNVSALISIVMVGLQTTSLLVFVGFTRYHVRKLRAHISPVVQMASICL